MEPAISMNSRLRRRFTNRQLRKIGRSKCIVCPTNLTVGTATALPAYYVLAALNTPHQAHAGTPMENTLNLLH